MYDNIVAYNKLQVYSYGVKRISLCDKTRGQVEENYNLFRDQKLRSYPQVSYIEVHRFDLSVFKMQRFCRRISAIAQT